MLELGGLIQKRLLPKIEQSVRQEGVRLDEKTILFLWERIFREAYGAAGSRKVEAVRCVENVLYLKSQSSLWRNEIVVEQTGLLGRLNAEAGSAVVSEIRFSTSSRN